jgi:hypothetical protein
MLSKKYNAEASPLNTFQFTKTGVGCCDGESLTDCQYRASFQTIKPIVSITLITASGVSTTYPIVYSGTAALRTRLAEIVELAGYVEMEHGDIEVTIDGGNTVITLRGELVAVSIVRNTNELEQFVALCNKATYCDYKLVTDGGATNSYVYNGVTTALGALVYGTATTTDVKDAVEAASDTATSVTVTDDTVGEQWVIMINAPLGTKIYLNSKQAEQCECKPTYVV